MPFRKWFEVWNRKFHIYLGLYLLLFVWLFSVSGLILNHPRWKFAQFWAQREQTSYEKSVSLPTEGGDVAKAKDLMRQLDITGEIQQITVNPDQGQFTFGVIRPNIRHRVQVDLNTKQATVNRIRVNTWGVMYALHVVSGVRMNNPELKRDWLMTKIWSFSMDAVSVGVIVMVLSGLYMWFKLKPKWRLGLIVLGLGVLSCGFFFLGLG